MARSKAMQVDDQRRILNSTPREMTGAQMVWEALVAEGCNVIFGHPGGAILPTYDALAPFEASGAMHHVLVRHGQVVDYWDGE